MGDFPKIRASNNSLVYQIFEYSHLEVIACLFATQIHLHCCSSSSLWSISLRAEIDPSNSWTHSVDMPPVPEKYRADFDPKKPKSWYCGHCDYGPHIPKQYEHCVGCGWKRDNIAYTDSRIKMNVASK